MNFDQVYQSLNDTQKKAVDTIEGPVLVVAGPGTGKTQLLSARVANILRRADVNPENILCMTFTEEAARNMRERLQGIIGHAAYDVGIYTFHSFGASIISQYNEYFYNGIGAEAIDELASFRIFHDLFSQLPHGNDNPLNIQYDGEFLYLRGAQQAIDNFKTAGLAPNEVKAIAENNTHITALINAIVVECMDGFVRMDKSSPERFKRLMDRLKQLPSAQTDTLLPAFVKPLHEIISTSLSSALEACEASGKTSSLTKWKDTYLARNKAGEWQLKDTDANKKLLALADIYERYLLQLRAQNLFDFNDMITRVVHALENFSELRLNLQEKYQYILVDEFQDTSLAQLRLIQSLTSNPVYEGRPNVLAVGDDDQAIYSFQGAELSNILSFHTLYKDVTVIPLTSNYRSHQTILDLARFVIEQSDERLTTLLEGITKDITAQNKNITTAHISHHRFQSLQDQAYWITEAIKTRLEKGELGSSIAVIAPKHKGLRSIVPFLHEANIPVTYDKQENILEIPAIVELITISRLILALGKNDQNTANALFPEVLSYQFWGLSTKQIWQLYLENYRKRSPWLEIALESKDERIVDIAHFLIALGLQTPITSLETMLDRIIGTESVTIQQAAGEQLMLDLTPTETGYSSPFKEYYFGGDKQRTDALNYLELLSHLHFLRDRLRGFQDGEYQTLEDLVSYVNLCLNAGITLVNDTAYKENEEAVRLFTAHGVKGLEFTTVFLIDTNQDIWTSSGGQQGKIAMPSNLPIERAGTNENERRRLLYVALTRAKENLIITGYNSSKRGNGSLKYLMPEEGTILPGDLALEQHEAETTNPQELLEELTTSWHERHVSALHTPEMSTLLMPKLAQYRLSVSHLHAFLNVTGKGPQQFLLRCLLQFPQRTSPDMAFGIAVHATIDGAHRHMRETGEQKPIDALLADFAKALNYARLDPETEKKLLERGQKTISRYFKERYASFVQNEYSEFDLGSRQIMIGEARVTGKVDLITPLVDGDYRVTDFKTSRRPIHSWDSREPFRAMQLYQYKQQLAFYRLLLEEGKAFGPNTHISEAALEFVEPDENGKLVAPLVYNPTDEDVARLRKLTTVVWKHIMNLDFPDTSQYDHSLKGLIAFEDDLLTQE